MSDDLESQIWRLALSACGVTQFQALLEQAIDCFKRSPGFDPLVRIHASSVGKPGFDILITVLLSRHARVQSRVELPEYVELRGRLANHLRCELQNYLLQNDRATDEIIEDQLGRELGL